MAGPGQQIPEQYSLIYTLSVQPGIKRDGTAFDAREYTDGVWCRFQRNLPKKMGGYRQMFGTFNGIPRGMILNASGGVNYIFSGNSEGIDIFTTGTSLGLGQGPFIANIVNTSAAISVESPTSTDFEITGDKISQWPIGSQFVTSLNPGATVYTVTNSTFSDPITTVEFTPTNLGTYSAVYKYSSTPVFTADQRNLWQFDMQYSPLGGELKVVAHPGLNLLNIDNDQPTQVLLGNLLPDPPTPATPGNPNSVTLPTVSSFRILGSTDYSLVYPVGSEVVFSTTPGAPTFTIASAVFSSPSYTDFTFSPNNADPYTTVYTPGELITTQNWTFIGLSDSTGQNPTYQPIAVSGGVCVLYPYLFAYGSNGFISNNHVSGVYDEQSITDWNGATANQVNMAAGKIVKGFPTRGGTNSPSGLFWATDSLIRVSFTGTAPLYWRYDIVSSQISIMSSSAVVEMDGAFFWMGVDRFYVYNGNVSVLSNDKNVNWLFNNLNYTQRQKVWATKVPRYNEIWFFYPRGNAVECTDAIIYNVKDKIWYDAGQAVGAQRSCGYTTEVFPTPIWASWNYNVQYSSPFPVIATPEGEDPPESNQFYLRGNVTTAISPGDYVQLSKTDIESTYLVLTSEFIINSVIGDPGATRITVEGLITTPIIGTSVYNVTGGYGIYQHEFGLNNVSLNDQTAITSSFTTCDISWVGGTPSQDSAAGVNRRMHLRRIEPDFVQAGTMGLTILGRKFAKGSTEISGPFYFEPDTGKIDLRVEHREVSFKFESNTLDGNYEMGRILITSEYGDERP
jgi:hypothetical protein